MPQRIRVSVGSAIVLGLLDGKLDAEPTTAYLMTYNAGKCIANCGFCPQARGSLSTTELLSRVNWPVFPTKTVLNKIQRAVSSKRIRRVCIQTLNYLGVFTHLAALVKAIKHHANVPVSISCQPINRENIASLAEAGADRIGIALDAATKNLFEEVKGSVAGGPYNWESQFNLLRKAVEVFGKGKVSTHIIIGLGETEKEAICLIQQCVDMHVTPALFAFTPIPGTKLEKKPRPEIESYRRVQLARHLIINRATRCENLRFDVSGGLQDFDVNNETLKSLVESGQPFLTSGCPNCNRPFYNERPSGPLYNYPRGITSEEITVIKRQLGF